MCFCLTKSGCTESCPVLSEQSLRASTPKGTFLPNSNADCLARCKAAGNAQAPAPQLSAASLDIPSSAGRKLL